MRKVILIRFGEIFLKGKNRGFFEKTLVKNIEEALQKFNDVIKKDAKNAYAHYYRGLIYDEQKQPKLAISDYLSVLNNSKDFPIANYMAAVDYDSLENYKEAYKYFKQFVDDRKTYG